MITVKIHDVLHDSDDWGMSPSELANYIERYVNEDSLVNVRIAKGWANSPIYLTIDTNAISMKSIRRLCYSVLRAFEHEVSGVRIDRATKDKNIRIVEQSPKEEHRIAQQSGEVFEGEQHGKK